MWASARSSLLGCFSLLLSTALTPDSLPLSYAHAVTSSSKPSDKRIIR